jgi:hypothetical protein
MIMKSSSHLLLHRDNAGRLVLTDSHGQQHVGIEPVRSFPLTEPDRFIALLDSRGREVAAISDVADIVPEIRELVLQELADREFLPRIERIVSVKMIKEPHEWNVVTDRGPAQFLMRDDDIRRLGPGRAILVDLHGVRYYIPDSRQLDPKSRRILSQYL